jgi:CRISPR-associated protein Cas2
MLVVSYDIRDDRRRLRVHKLLEGFGRAVQRSVFECDLTDAEYAWLRQRLERVVEPGVDLVRYYRLCEGCVRRIEGVGGGPPERAAAYYVV